jgi:TMEM175 potassium channel family protein
VNIGRLEAFSDGVFAVAITILALNLSVGKPGLHQPSLAAQLAVEWPAFAAYAVSFATIGIIWVNHHTLFKNFAEIDRTLLFLNLLLLFFVVTIPFATSMIAAYLRQGGPDASLAAAIYQGVFVGMSLSFAGLFWWGIRRKRMKIAFTPEGARRATIRFGIGNVAYLAAIGIALLSATASLIVSGLVAIYYIFEQTPTGETTTQAGGTPPDAGSGE